MPIFFASAAEVSKADSYKKKLKPALLKVGSTKDRFTYFEKFKFDTGERAAFIPGKLDPAVTKELEKVGQKPARGFCTFSADGGLDLVVTKGQVDEDKVRKTLQIAGLTCAVTISTGVDSGLDEELEQLEGAAPVSAGTAAFGATLNAHLAGKTPADREAHARQALQMGEDATNAGKVGGQPHSHSLSAHGPGTDQTPRIVAGYRADQVADGAAAGTNPANVDLVATDGRTASIPGYTQVGDEPVDASSSFESATAMLAAITEAIAQVTLLESFIAKEVKEAKSDMRVLDVPSVKAALKTLIADRGALDAAKKALEQLKGGRTAKAELTAVNRLSAALDKSAKAFRDAKEAAMANLPTEEPSLLASRRQDPTVTPGMTTGASFKTTGPAVVEGQPIDKATMDQRFEAMTTTPGLDKATIVLDQAYVERPDGTKSRAGWQAQTAFPTTDPETPAVLTPVAYSMARSKERFDKAVAVVKTIEDRRTAVLTEEVNRLAERKAARTAFERANAPVFETPRGTPVDPEAQRLSDEAAAAQDAAESALTATRARLTAVNAALVTAREARAAAEEALRALEAAA